MIRLFMLVTIGILSMAGCQSVGSASPSAISGSGPRVAARVGPPSSLAQADVLVVFGNVAEADDAPLYCPVAAVTVADALEYRAGRITADI